MAQYLVAVIVGLAVLASAIVAKVGLKNATETEPYPYPQSSTALFDISQMHCHLWKKRNYCIRLNLF